MNYIKVDGVKWGISPQYKNGALSQREGKAKETCPHRPGSKRYGDWQSGYDHEIRGMHTIGHVDVIKLKPGRYLFLPEGQ